MRANFRLLIAFGVATLAACSTPPRNPPAGPPDITTATLDHAFRGLAVRWELTALVAEIPVTWSFAVDPSPSLSWLALSADGVLSGTPPDALAGEPITVRATDARGQFTDKTFTVIVDLCEDGDAAACSFAADGACTVGATTCSAGSFGSCAGSLSTDAAQCGASCSPCAANADACSAGADCRCGEGEPCTGTNTSSATCSGGTCVNVCSAGSGDCDGTAQNGCETSLLTMTNCGTCGVPCNTPTYGTASCATGTCVRSCPNSRVLSGSTCVCGPGLGDCDGNPLGGCETSLLTMTNCGACGVPCNAPTYGSAICETGTCIQSCPARRVLSGSTCVCNTAYTDCSGSCVNLNSDDWNCGACGNVCFTTRVGWAAYCREGSCRSECITC